MSKSGTKAQVIRGVMAILAALVASAGARADVQTLPVPKIVIYPGETISDQVLVDHEFNAEWSSKMPIARARSELTGKVVRRTLLPGKPIPINAIRVPDAVTQGKTYRIEFREAGLVISGTAVATSSGAVGDVVSLRNPDSGTVVRGVVNPDGIVRMGMQ